MSKRAATSRHPVIIATGEKSLDQLDFELPGPIELEWRRQYRSGDARREGWFGQGWSHSLATELWVEDDVIRYWDEQGREVVLPAIAVGQEHFEAYEQFTLTRPKANHWALRHNQGLTHHFRQRHARQARLPLEVVQDRNMRRVVLQFDDRDFGDGFNAQALPPRPHRLIDSAGRTVHLVWTDQKQLAEVIVEAGGARVVMARYGYAGVGHGQGQPDLLSHTNANGHTRSYAWEQHLLVGYTLATGQRFSNRYDRLIPAGRVTESLALDDGTGDWFDYNGRTTRVRDRLGRETIYVSNARQDLIAIHDAEGNVTRFGFDVEGRPEGNTDALGRSSVIDHDRRGNVTQLVDPAGHTTRLAYGAMDLPIKLTDAMGGEWQRQYDERGNLVRTIDPLGHSTLFELDALGQVTGIIDALDKRKTLQWDMAGNLQAYTDCSANTTQMTYDALGRLRSSTDAVGQRTDYLFDAAGRLQQVILPDGAQHHYTWDGEGHLIRYVDPLGRTTTWQRNGAGEPVLRTDALGKTQRYHYDQAGRLITLTNEIGDCTQFAYDLLDRLTDEIGFDGRHQRYIHDAVGDLTHVIERGGSDFGPGKVTRFDRDAVGQITSRHHVGEAMEFAASCRFEYDALGRLTRAANAASEVRLVHDPLGRVLAETQVLHAEAGARIFEFKHQYDALGNRTRTTLPGGQELNQLFFGSGHLHQINLDGRVISDFERDPLYREVRRSQGQLHSEFAYDRAGHLIAQHVLRTSTAGSSSLPSTLSDPKGRLDGGIERHYHYDVGGQLMQRIDRRWGLTSYGYDALGRVTRAQRSPSQSLNSDGSPGDDPRPTGRHAMAFDEAYRWDAAGNPLSSDSPADGTRRTGGPDGDVRGNRLRVWQDARYSYDEHGNLIERLQGKRGSAAQTRTRLTWDAAHQLIRADVTYGPDETGSTRSFRYVYDALGRRIAKIDASGATRFAWDGDRISLEQGAGREIIHIHHPGSFVPLAQIHHGVLHHLHTDQVGTPLEATDDSGTITWRAAYRTWGTPTTKDVTDIDQNLRFQGQYFDAETGLHYNRFRYYDPEPGRFISQDPIGLDGGTNLYQYAPNPITWIDPLGLVLSHVRFPESKIIKRVVIKMQGSRPEDFKEANRIAKLHGCRGKPTQSSEKHVHGDVTWHHATYNKKTNTAVMELVSTADHEATFPHAGSVSDFEKAHNVEYGTQEALDLAAELNGECPCK